MLLLLLLLLQLLLATCRYLLRGRRVRRVVLRRVGHLLQLGQRAGRRPGAPVVLLLLLEGQVAALVAALHHAAARWKQIRRVRGRGALRVRVLLGWKDKEKLRF